MAQDKDPKQSDYALWKTEVDAARERQKNFWKDGGAITKRFLDSDRDDKVITGSSGLVFRLNLFHANITTLCAMLYGRVPETDVSRRWADPDDDVARVASEITRRLLDLSIQPPGSSDADILRACLQDRLLPGMGQARIRYSFAKETIPIQYAIPHDELGEELVTGEQEVIVDEAAPLEYVHWRDFLWGYGRIWAEVPWVGFVVYPDREEAERRFGEEIAAKLQYKTKPVGTKEDSGSDPSQDDTWYKATLIEIWDKRTRKVVWFSEDLEELLDPREDPLDLDGFFPCPPPMASNLTTDLFLPRSDFKIAQDLYNQIDYLQTRIGILTKAVKAVGVYNGASDEIKRVFQEGTDNDLIPVENFAKFSEAGGLKGQIDWVPLKDITEAITKLQELRDENIRLLYEITGMSDILRGASEQYTAASSDKLKAKFASIRVQYLQDEFARFCSDLMSIRAQVVRKHFEPESIYVQGNCQYFSEDPQIVEEAIGLLKKDGNEYLWKIEIKPETIAMIDYAQLKTERTEYLTAVGTFLQSMKPFIEELPEAIPVLAQMLKWGMAGFKGGREMEGQLDQFIKMMIQKAQNPQPQGPNPKVQEIQAKSEAESRKIQEKAQADLMKLLTQHKTKLAELVAVTDSEAMKEKVQSFFNILETEAKMEADKEVKRVEAQYRRRAGE